METTIIPRLNTNWPDTMRPPFIGNDHSTPSHPLFFTGACAIVSANIAAAIGHFIPSIETALRIIALVLSVVISVAYMWREILHKRREKRRRVPRQPSRYPSRLPLLLALGLCLAACGCVHTAAIMHEMAQDTNMVAMEIKTIYGTITVYRNYSPVFAPRSPVAVP